MRDQKEKDQDPRPLLERVRDALQDVPGITIALEGEPLKLTAQQQATAVAEAVEVSATEPHGVKGVNFRCKGVSPQIQKAVYKVKGARGSSFGYIEVSWRGLEEFCAVLAKALKPVKPKAPEKPVSPKAFEQAFAYAEAAGLHCVRDITAGINGCVRTRYAMSHDENVRMYACRTGLELEFAYQPDAVEVMRGVPGAKFGAESKRWTVKSADVVFLEEAIPAICRALTNAIAAQRVAAAEKARVQAEEKARAEHNRRAAYAAAVERNRPAREAEARERAAEAARKLEENPRLLMLMSRPYLEGEVIRSGGRALVVTGFGKTWTVDEDMPSMHGSWLLGHEGERCCYAFCRKATPAETTTLEGQEAAAAAEKAAREQSQQNEKVAIAAIRREGEFVPAQPAPEGEYLVRSESQQRLYGCGTDVLQEADGSLWLIDHHGADGDNWAANNLPGARGWKLQAGDRAQELAASLAPTSTTAMAA